MNRSLLFAFILLIMLTSGCNFFAPPAAEQTRVADHAATATQMANIRQTATLQADRLAITLEYAQTAVSAANAQSTRISATLMATGMATIDTSNLVPLLVTPASNENNSSSPPVFAITPVTSGQGAQGNATLLNEPELTPVITGTIDPDAPRLADIVLTTAVGANDCPTNPTTVFATNVQGVYVSAVAYNLTPANTIASRWLREGIEAVNYPWSPSFEIREGCIWFYMPASDVDFSPGNWSVQLELDGVPVGQPVTFTVSGTANPADTMEDTTMSEETEPLPGG